MVVSLPAGRMSCYLDKLVEYHGYPIRVRVDNGAKLTINTFIDWVKSHSITLDGIQPGSP
jgi:putative transposase